MRCQLTEISPGRFLCSNCNEEAKGPPGSPGHSIYKPCAFVGPNQPSLAARRTIQIPGLNGPAPPNGKLLIKHKAGLGDHVKLTVLLRHLQHYFPQWQVEVASALPKLFTGLFPSHSLGRTPPEAEYVAVREVKCANPHGTAGAAPATFIEDALRRLFVREPLEELCQYLLLPSEHDFERARLFLNSHCEQREDGKFQAVVLHYEGNSYKAHKNLSHATAAAVIDEAVAAGYTVVLLDWSQRSPHSSRRGVVNPGRGHRLWTGGFPSHPLTIAAVIELSAAFVGIDSGPSYIAGATNTPGLVNWVGYHPANLYHLAPNIIHVVPDDVEQYLRGNAAAKQAGTTYFHRRYAHAYTGNDREGVLASALALMLQDELAALEKYRPLEPYQSPNAFVA